MKKNLLQTSVLSYNTYCIYAVRNLLDAHRNNKVGNIHWHLKMNEKTINSVDQCVPAESDVFSPQT